MQQQDSWLATGYRHFMTVAETGSVRAAARQINVAASAISRQISMLEANLGMVLFDRSGRSLQLSPAGEVLLRGLRGTAQAHEETLDLLDAMRGVRRGRVRIATVESISVSVLPELLLAFGRHYPGVQVSVTVAGSDAVAELVRDHSADIGFTFNPSVVEGLKVEISHDMQLGAVMAPSHMLAGAKKLTLKECFAHPIAWPARGLSLRAILDRAVLGKIADFRPAYECNSLRLMAALAMGNGCIAFQTVIGIEQEIAEGRLVFVPLGGQRLAADRLMVVRRTGIAGRPAADAFLALIPHHLPLGNGVRK